MIKIAIVEDTPSDAEKLKEYTENALKAVGETSEITVFNDALTFLAGYRGDYGIVFMDIELPDIDGMEAAKRLRAVDAEVILIFVTNMAQFAVGGYAVDAMDFMVKPVSYENVCLKMARAVRKIKSCTDDKFALPSKTGFKIISIPEIRYVEVLNHKLTFHTTRGEVTASGSLNKVEDKLTRFNFSRCNNYALVNLRLVTSVEDFTVYLGEVALPVSRARKKPFLEDLADFLGGRV